MQHFHFAIDSYKGGGANYGSSPNKIFTVLHTDNILEIRDGGVTVFD